MNSRLVGACLIWLASVRGGMSKRVIFEAISIYLTSSFTANNLWHLWGARILLDVAEIFDCLQFLSIALSESTRFPTHSMEMDHGNCKERLRRHMRCAIDQRAHTIINLLSRECASSIFYHSIAHTAVKALVASSKSLPFVSHP